MYITYLVDIIQIASTYIGNCTSLDTHEVQKTFPFSCCRWNLFSKQYELTKEEKSIHTTDHNIGPKLDLIYFISLVSLF